MAIDVASVVQNIRDRQEEICTLTNECNDFSEKLDRSIRDGEATSGSDIEDYLILRRKYDEEAKISYENLERYLSNYHGELILTVERQWQSIEHLKSLSEVFSLTILQDHHLVLKDRSCTKLFFNTRDPSISIKMLSHKRAYRAPSNGDLFCPDLDLMKKPVSLWGDYSHRYSGRRSSTDVPALEIIAGNKEVRDYMGMVGPGALRVYEEMYRVLFPVEEKKVVSLFA